MAIILQDYERLKFLGKGAFAQIYKVRHKDLGYVRAIKVLTEEINEGEDDKEDKVYKTFLKECSLLLRIGNGGHPNIIRIYQPRKIDGKALVEMDYIDGETFESFVSKNKFIPIEEIYRFIREIGSALAYCHVDCYRYMMRPEEKDQNPKDLIQKYGVAHNDIHSNNIMRKELDGSYILLDFGLAIQDDKAVKSSSRGDGAAEYLPPEKWAGDLISNEKAVDIYGFGILIYQMLAGQVPFILDINEYKKDSLKTLNKIRQRHESEKPADILPLRKAAYEVVTGKDDYKKDFPEWLEELVFKCLEKQPEKRFHDAKELQEFFISHYNDDMASKAKTIESLQKANKALNQNMKDLEMTIETIKNNSNNVSSNKNKWLIIGLSILTSILALTLMWGFNKYHNDSIDSKSKHVVFYNQDSYSTPNSENNPEPGGLNKEKENQIDNSENESNDAQTIAALESNLSQKELEIAALKSDISLKDNDIESLKADIKQKESTIARLQASDLSETVESQKQTINTLQKQVQSLTKERDESREQVKRLINSTL